MPFDLSAFDEALNNARGALLDARNHGGWWEGELSASALSTATAVFALSLHRQATSTSLHDAMIGRGLQWLIAHQNADGGWGDTVKSFSNVSTTALCWAAVGAAGDHAENAAAMTRAEKWLTQQAGGLEPGELTAAIIRRYGKDRTFSVPILTMCALAGRLGAGREAWKNIPQLPLELAAFPQRWFKWMRLPVVSYALPALIAIGLVRHRRRPTRNPLAGAIRALSIGRAMKLLTRIQPGSGGFLEATPLTSFVVMSLIGAGCEAHPVVHRGVKFLTRSVREDGSWPIDTNLATWLTTLSIHALAEAPGFEEILPAQQRVSIRDWLLGQQYLTEHPYTLAEPGCWAWTDLSGGVPDADDTPGALLALLRLGPVDDRAKRAGAMGVRWLIDLQNRDGGVPTFCRGWGNLPFDRSSADLSAHALRAWGAWLPHLSPELAASTRAAMRRAMRYLIATQRADGAWTPLWFGNQHAVEEENAAYGTARVVLAYGCDPGDEPAGWEPAMRRAVDWLVSIQNPDGGWGGDRGTPSSIEETAMAVEALSHYARLARRAMPAVLSGAQWLVSRTKNGRVFEPSPIGFYFAKLWYFEKLYPIVFTVAALQSVANLLLGQGGVDGLL